MLKYIASNKAIVALIFTSIISLVFYFNNRSPLIEFIHKNWLDLKIYITSPKIELKDFAENKKKLNQIKLEEIKFKLNYEYQQPYVEFLEALIDSKGIKNLKRRFSNQDSSIFILANVLWHANPQISSSVLINAGTSDFPKGSQGKNFIVVDEFGNLVGRIINIGKDSSTVQLINDFNNKIILEQKHKSNNFTALMTPISYNKSKLLGVSLNDDISLGDTLYTSYKSNVYIDRIPVCKVVNISNEINLGAFKTVIVENLANLNYINNVILIGVDIE